MDDGYLKGREDDKLVNALCSVSAYAIVSSAIDVDTSLVKSRTNSISGNFVEGLTSTRNLFGAVAAVVTFVGIDFFKNMINIQKQKSDNTIFR